MPYVVAGFAVIWVITFLYLLSLGNRQRRLAGELEDLQAEMEQTR